MHIFLHPKYHEECVSQLTHSWSFINLWAFNNLWPAFTNLGNSFWMSSSWWMQTPWINIQILMSPLILVNNSRHMYETQLHSYKHFSVFHVFLKLFLKLWNESWCFLTLLHDIVKYNLCTGLRWRNWENWNFLFTNHWWSQHELTGWLQLVWKDQHWNFIVWLHIILIHMNTSTAEQQHPKQPVRNLTKYRNCFTQNTYIEGY